eukprot:677212-Amphidinium_carterae.1
MLTVQQQQQQQQQQQRRERQRQRQRHRREPPSVLEGNQHEQSSGPVTTFKNWATQLQIDMSMEDAHTNRITDYVKCQTVLIIDANYIEHRLDKNNN